MCFECGLGSSPFDLFENKCIDKCGDGWKFTSSEVIGLYNYNNCDDGNTNNGDGCSSDCQVEENYVCSGGNSN